MKKKIIIAIVAVFAICAPAFAVFNERNLGQTISVLRFELKQQYDKMSSKEDRMNGRNNSQHRMMIDMVKKCNELSLILYSQNQDFTFDHTYALGEVTKEYEKFSNNKLPYDDIVFGLDIEIDRYERLLESLRRLPPSLPPLEDVPDSLVRTTWRARSGSSPVRTTVPTVQMDSASRARAAERRRAFMLDEEGQEDRDSCIFYATQLLRQCKAQKAKTVRDSEFYSDMDERLGDSYNYAQRKYRQIQKHIFVDGQDNYFTVLGSFRRYAGQAFQEAHMKYSTDHSHCEGEEHHHASSEWRGPVVSGFIIFVLICLFGSVVLAASLVIVLSRKVKFFQSEDFKSRRKTITLLIGTVIFAVSVMIVSRLIHHNFIVEASGLLLVFTWLLIAILVSLLIRLDAVELNNSLKVYTPMVVMGLLVITFRIIFIPNHLLNLFYPPLLLGFAIWQLCINCSRGAELKKSDRIYAWLTFVVILASTVVSWSGYVLMAVQVFIWWLFQITAVETVTALSDILGIYEKKYLRGKIRGYKRGDGENIDKTWAFDLFNMALLPVGAILSVLGCIWLAVGIFDLTAVCKTIFYHPFFNLSDAAGNPVLHLSLFKLVLVCALYFIFRYANYVAKAVYKQQKLASLKKASGKHHIHANEVNLTLAFNLIAILVWGSYTIFAIVLLKIPMGAISVVAAGLATGIGLALKDVLNNFIYGIQLMSGRLRVGDYIECDGVRGKVDSISYQTTQIITPDGAVMSFTNATLFNKNFKNLTRNNAYELVTIPVGVAYGANVQQVRTLIVEALQELCRKDDYGREIVDNNRGISVAFSDFGESSVDLLVKQFVLVEEKIPYMAQARELIYDTLNKNGIEIPFPQRDLYIKQLPQK